MTNQHFYITPNFYNAMGVQTGCGGRLKEARELSKFSPSTYWMSVLKRR